MCVVSWVVAISVAFAFYIPVLRARRQVARAGPPAVQPFPDSLGDDLDQAPA